MRGSMNDEEFIIKLVLGNGEVRKTPVTESAAWNLMVDLWTQFGMPRLEQQPAPEDHLKILVAE